MTGGPKLATAELHKAIIDSLGASVAATSPIDEKPLDMDLKPPLPSRLRCYVYNATHPPGGRTTGEYKIQLILPGQRYGTRASFDHSDSRFVIIAGYAMSLGVFILWDAGMYPDIAYSRNVQVRSETLYAALRDNMGRQYRRIRGQGEECVITARPEHLSEAIQERVKITEDRFFG